MSGNDPRFVLFGAAHLAAVAGTCLIGGGVCILLRATRARPTALGIQRTVCIGLALVLLTSWLAEDVVLMARRAFSVQTSLPLHLCDLGVVVCAVTLIWLASVTSRANGAAASSQTLQTLYELAYFWGLGGTTQALLTPDLEPGFPSFLCIRFFVTHGGIIVAVLGMTIGLGLRPRPGAVPRVWLMTAALLPPMLLVNWLLDANYMFLCGPPKQPSLYDYFGPWPWSLLTLAAVAWVLLGLCYLPFWIADRRRRSSAPPVSPPHLRAR